MITDKTMFLAGLAGFDLGCEISAFKDALYQVKGNKVQLDRFAEQLLREVMPDDWFPDSKDWQYSVWERAEIMKRKIESYKEEIERLENWLEAKQELSGTGAT